MHVLTTDFAARLTAARKQRGITQQALAERAGVHVTQVRRYEAGCIRHFVKVCWWTAPLADQDAE